MFSFLVCLKPVDSMANSVPVDPDQNLDEMPMHFFFRQKFSFTVDSFLLYMYQRKVKDIQGYEDQLVYLCLTCQLYNIFIQLHVHEGSFLF